MSEQQIQLFASQDGQVQLKIKLEQETLWLSQSQIRQLLDTSTDNVSLHLKDIYQEGELDEQATTGRQRVAENCFYFFLIPIPPRDLLESFSSSVMTAA